MESMQADIDKLNIEISSNADKAEKSIDKLTDSLSRLKDIVAKNTGLNNLSKQIQRLQEASQKLSGLNAYTERINKFSESMQRLTKLKIPSVTAMLNSISKLVVMSKEMASFDGAEKFAQNVEQITSAMKPMESIGKNTFAPFINSLNKIPQITKSIDTTTLQEFKKMIVEITSAIQPLTSAVSKSEKGLDSLNRIIQSTVSKNGNLAASNAATVKSYTSLSSILTSVKVKIVAYAYTAIKIVNIMKEWLNTSNDYIENLNLFSVAMGDEAQSALDYAEAVNKVLNIDVSNWIRNQGVFKQVTSGFGVINDKADIMSQELTQLGYDISSFFNISVDDAMQKLQSGISGEIEPLRRLGYALDAATLQQIAYANGITQNINTMTQAQKSQLRYIAIMQQSGNAMGDMARTISSPSNAMRILNEQATQFKRAIGNIISIVAQKMLPYIQAFIRLLSEGADYLAKLWGFELPTIDYSNVSNGLSNVTDEADSVTESIKETTKEMQRLAGFDEINILSSNKSDSDSDSSTDNSNFDLGIELPKYDFLQGLDDKSDEIYQNMKDKALDLIDKFKELLNWIKENKDFVGKLALAFAGLYTASKIKKFFNVLKDNFTIIKKAKDWVKKLKDGKFGKGILSIFTGISFGTIGGLLGYDLAGKIQDGTLTWKDTLLDIGGIVASIVAAFAIGGPISGGIAAIGTVLGLIIGDIVACNNKYIEMQKIMINGELFNNGGTKISELTEAFGKQFSKLEELNGKLKDYDQKIDDNRTLIDDYRETVETYANKLSGTGTLAEHELGLMKEAVDNLADSLKTAMDLDCSKFFEIVKTSISKVAEDVGIDVGKMTSTIEEFQRKFSGNVSKAQQTVSNYVSKVASGEEVTKAETQQYENELAYLTNMGSDITQAKTNFQNALQNVNTIDFESESATKEALGDLKKYAEEAQKDAKETYQSSLNTYDNLMQNLEYEYSVGNIDKGFYNKVKKQLDDFKLGAETAYKQNREEIQSSLESVLQPMYDNANNALFEQINNRKSSKEYSSKNAKSEFNKLKKEYDYLYDDLSEIAKENGIKLSEDSVNAFVNSFNGNTVKGAISKTVENTFADYNELVGDQTAITAGTFQNQLYTTIQDGIKNGDSYKEIAEDLTKLLAEGMDNGAVYTSETAKQIKEQILTHIDPSSEAYNIADLALSKAFTDGMFKGSRQVNKTALKIAEGINTTVKNYDYDGGKYFCDEIATEISNNTPHVTNTVKDLCDSMVENFFPDGLPWQNLFNNFDSMYSDSVLYVEPQITMLPGAAKIASSMSVKGYATGGFPKKADLFYANENGPEMVGTIGGSTAVASNDQITEAISKAVYNAVKAANSGQSNDVNITVPVYYDSQLIEEQQYKYNQRQDIRSNGRR